MKYGIFIGYTFSPAWLAKSWDEREQFQQEHLAPLYAKYTGRLSIQQYDAEAFSASPTDFAFIETEDLTAYYFFIEELRDTPLFAQGLARIDVIHVGLADGYRHFAQEVLHADDDR
ncbi:darcynin family protein [Streptomyces sp. NPDC053069]|uniref:darcynin family protein n=1 Tax=Streptomyces sp. NPDC053069 TaxID=3365695 RepID=UPI0037D1E47B